MIRKEENRKIKITPQLALAGVAQWIEHQTVNQRVASLIPSQGTCLGFWARCPVRGVQEVTHSDVSLPLSLALPSPL